MTPGDQASSTEKGPHFQQGGGEKPARLQSDGPHRSLPGQVRPRTLRLDLCTVSTEPRCHLAVCCERLGSPLDGLGTSPRSPPDGLGTSPRSPPDGLGTSPRSPLDGLGTSPRSPLDGLGTSPRSPLDGLGTSQMPTSSQGGLNPTRREVWDCT